MIDDRTSEDEGSRPSSDIEKQNRETGGPGESRAGAGEGNDADHSDTKAQDLAKAGCDHFDPNAGQD